MTLFYELSSNLQLQKALGLRQEQRLALAPWRRGAEQRQAEPRPRPAPGAQRRTAQPQLEAPGGHQKLEGAHTQQVLKT